MMRRAGALLTIVLGLTACGEHTYAQPVSPTALSACLTFVLEEDHPLENRYDRDVQLQVMKALQASMVEAGFNVLLDPRLPHDLVAHVTATPGSRVQAGANLELAFKLETQGMKVDEFVATAPQDSFGFDLSVANQIVDALFKSIPLKTFTHDLRKPGSKLHLAAGGLGSIAAQTPACAGGGIVTASVPAASTPAVAPAAAVSPPSSQGPSDFVAGPPQPSSYAFIVGVEDYRSATKVKGALHDAETFARFAKQTLGVPESHIKMVANQKADKLAFDLVGEWLGLNVQPGARIYFYFSGRGAMRGPAQYLLPYDGEARTLDRSGVAVLEFLQMLAATKAKEVVAFIDAGFSGESGHTSPSADAHGGSNKDAHPASHVAVFTAVTGLEIANSRPSGGGVFSSYVTDGLGKGLADIDGDGQISLQELATWMGPRLAREAKRSLHPQTPMIQLGPATAPAAQIILVGGLPVQ